MVSWFETSEGGLDLLICRLVKLVKLDLWMLVKLVFWRSFWFWKKDRLADLDLLGLGIRGSLIDFIEFL
jgi:hypothetical protein